jgi:uncharacterized damage-inducible protein DinB
MHQLFLKYSVEKLEQYESRINACLDRLTYQQVWARNADAQNAIGNLVLHLCGNVRQWLLSGVGGMPDTRNRDGEFAARDAAQIPELKLKLHETVAEATHLLRTIPPERLTEPLNRQGYDVTVLEGIYHVVEHFAGHTGQIIFATKLLTSEDLGFYRHLTKAAHTEQTP